MGLNLDRDGHLIDEPNFAVGLEPGQFWQDAYARDTEAVEHRLNHPWQPDAISREEMITAAIETTLNTSGQLKQCSLRRAKLH